jgi:hypothetical protein
MGAKSCNFNSPDEIMVTGAGKATELLRRRKVLIPEKLKFFTRKSNLQKLI